MSTIGILEWQNAHALSDYPLTNFIGLTDFIVDASFVQFDGFVPILLGGRVDGGLITLNVQFDMELVTILISQATYIPSTGIRIYAANGRYLGTITFGYGVNVLFSTMVGQVFDWEVPFVSSTVVSINSNGGVYSIEKLFGDLKFDTGDDPLIRSIFYNISGNNVTWNAVALAAIDNTINALRSINGIAPINNEVTIQDSTLIKVTAGPQQLTINLANNGVTSNIGPVLNFG